MSRIDAALPEQQQQEKKEADAKTLAFVYTFTKEGM